MNDEPPQPAPLHPLSKEWSNNAFTAAWGGHATVLINCYGKWILTDLVFSERIGLDVLNFFTIGPRRLILPALTLDELPPLDLILLSHGHMDHFDIPTLRKLDGRTPVDIAKNTYDLIEDLGFERVYELDWRQHAVIDDIRVEALEVQHFGWRYPWERDRSRGNPDGRSYNG